MASPDFSQSAPSSDFRLMNDFLTQDLPPDYTPRAVRATPTMEYREFEYKVEKKKGAPIASLKVLAPNAYSKAIPTFYGCGPVKGTASLFLEIPDTITSVVLSVSGRFLPGHVHSTEQLTLFDISTILWPNNATHPASTPFQSKRKLSGTHSWPFCVNIPEEIQLTTISRNNLSTYPTPHTFAEKFITASVRYEVVLRVARGKLKNDYEIRATFGYVPILRPPPLPALRAVSYQERTPLLDPIIDVEGWVEAGTAEIAGTLFSRPVTISCQMFLATPLVYTRGSVIPLYLRLQSASKYALDLLATHNAVTARLRRTIYFCPPTQSVRNPRNFRTGRDKRELVEAVWWNAHSQDPGNLTTSEGSQIYTACLNGELHLGVNLAPSTTFPALNIEYHVCLRAFDAPGFKVLKAEKSLLDHPVDIATLPAPGPRVIRYAPAGQKSERPLDVEARWDGSYGVTQFIVV